MSKNNNKMILKYFFIIFLLFNICKADELNFDDLVKLNQLANLIPKLIQQHKAFKMQTSNESCLLYNKDESLNKNGWLLVAQRLGRKHFEFKRSWAEYKNGFGDPATNYFIGNQKLNELTRTPKEFRIELFYSLESINIPMYVYEFGNFSVGNEESAYTLSIGQPIYGNTSFKNGLSELNGFKFNTYDKYVINCPDENAGWWFKSNASCSSTTVCLFCDNIRFNDLNFNEMRIYIK